MDVLEACILGYSDSLIDRQAIAAQTGYWSAYYQSKRPKKISSIIQSILSNRSKKSTTKKAADISDSDIQQFMQREMNRVATQGMWKEK